MSFNIEIESGTTARLLVGGKYCDRDIVVTAKSDDLAKQIVERSITTLVNDQLQMISNYGLSYCTAMTYVKLPNCTFLNAYALYFCTHLTKADFAKRLEIQHSAFGSCKQLTALILRGNSVSSLVDTNAFKNTPIADGTGFIYVPSSLVDTYKNEVA